MFRNELLIVSDAGSGMKDANNTNQIRYGEG